MSLSEVDRSIARYMFYFAVFNVFLGGVVGSTIIQGINSAITRGPSEIFTLIGTYLPTSSNFFINYTLFRCGSHPHNKHSSLQTVGRVSTPLFTSAQSMSAEQGVFPHLINA